MVGIGHLVSRITWRYTGYRGGRNGVGNSLDVEYRLVEKKIKKFRQSSPFAVAKLSAIKNS